MRYIPTFRVPRDGSVVITIGRVMYRPASPGHVVRKGMWSRSISRPCITTSWQGARPLRVRGGNFPISRSFGSIASFPKSPSGTFTSSISAIRRPGSSRSSAPSAISIRRIDPKRLMATGNALRSPLSRTTFSNSSAGPPPGLFMHRSAISATSSRARTSSFTRTSSPASSIARMKSLRLSIAIRPFHFEPQRRRGRRARRNLRCSCFSYSLFFLCALCASAVQKQSPNPDVHRRNPCEIPLEGNFTEARLAHTPSQRLRLRKDPRRLWKPAIRGRMFGHQPSNARQDVLEVAEVEGPHRLSRRRAHLQHHEPRSRLEHPRRLAEAGVEIREVPDAPSDGRPVEGCVPKRQLQCVGDRGRRPPRLVPTELQHRQHEVGADDPAPESRLPRQGRREVEGAGAEVEIRPLRSALPVEPLDGLAPPPEVEPHADDPVEPVVGGRDGGEHGPHIGPLRGTVRNR